MANDLKIKIAVAVAVVFVALAAIGYDLLVKPDTGGAENMGRTHYPAAQSKVPDFSFVTLDGAEQTVTGMEEPVVLLHFWASWCATCIVEFPALFELIEKNGGRVALIAVSIDDEKTAMTGFLERLQKRQGLETDIPHIYWVWDENKMVSRDTFGVVRVPETIFIDPHRFMVTKMVGETEWLGGEVINTIDTLSASKKL